MTAYGLPRGRFALLFAVMLVAAAGNTALQSLMPSIGRRLGVPDLWVVSAFSLSAIIWVVAAPHWARLSDRRGRRALMRLGLAGFIASFLICGVALGLALHDVLAPVTAFVIFTLGRTFYGWLGSASPPAVQAYVAARTDGEQRTNALAAIASSFSLGTILGPAVAPLFVLPPLDLSGPLIAFALAAAVVLLLIATRLPDDTPQHGGRGRIPDYPWIGAGPPPPRGDTEQRAPLRWRDPRVRAWLAVGAVGGHGHAALLGVIGFLVLDRLDLSLAEAPQWIAVVLMIGALATLAAQWWLIPLFHLGPAALVLWGSLASAVGSLLIAFAAGIHAIALGFALASLGFGFFRPGFTSGASLAVEPHEQNAVAGLVTSVNGIAFVAAPTAAIALYSLWLPLPFLATGVLMLALAAWIRLRPGPLSLAG